MPAALAPVDTNVTLPPSVIRAAEIANAAHQAVYGDQPQPDTNPQPEATPAPQPDTNPQPEAPPQPQPEPTPAPQPEPSADQGPVSAEEWQHRYNSMRGRFEQSQRTIGSMQEQMSELGDELVRTQQLLTQPQRRQQAPQPAPQPVQVLTDEDKATYGPEFLEVVKRAAAEVVQPQIQRVERQTQQVNQRVVQQTQAGVYQTLGEEIPNWQAINNSPRFKEWMRLPDLYSGVVRGKLLRDAFQAANAPRVVAFFRGFLAEEVATGQQPDPTGQQPAPQPPARTPAVPLESLAAPGRARPATGDTSTPADKPVFTRAQIAFFYSQAGRQSYVGREDDRKRDENALFLAQREGRVKG